MTLDGWIDLARGPLFRLSLAVCVLRPALSRGRDVPPLPGGAATRGRTGAALRPDRSAHPGLAGAVAHPAPAAAVRRGLVGLSRRRSLLVPLFYLGHVGLLAGWLPTGWPVLSDAVADVLTWLGVGGLAVLLGGRLLVARSRDLTRFPDAAVLAVLLAALLSGFWAAHPDATPVLSPRGMVLRAHAAGQPDPGAAARSRRWCTWCSTRSASSSASWAGASPPPAAVTWPSP